MTASTGRGQTPGLESADRAAMRAALQLVAPDLLAYFERRLARDEAADALAETLLQAWRRVDSLPEEPTLARMWLFRIASNALANHRRAGRRRQALADRLRANLTQSQVAVPDLAEQHAVRDAILRLPIQQREVVMLVHWDGLTLTETAQVLGINPSTARTRYATARRILRQALTTEDSHA